MRARAWLRLAAAVPVGCTVSAHGSLAAATEVVATAETALPAGRHCVTLAYRAAQNRNSSCGIFTLEDGGTWYSMTQFELISARKAFPCVDEPHFKAPWRIALRIPRNMTAVSNTPVVAEEDVRDAKGRPPRADRRRCA